MKRVLYILLIGAAMGWPQALPAVDASDVRARTEAVASEAAVQGGVGQIVFTAGDSDAVFSVYAITGQLLRSVKVQAGSRATVDMPKGFYIVRCGTRWSRKVVVR